MDVFRLLARSVEFAFVVLCSRKTRRKDKDAVAPSQEESKLYLEPAVLECTIDENMLREVVELPSGLDYTEWLASHTLAFFDHVNLIYGTVSEFCTMSGCPDMIGPCSRQYLWFDEKGKKCKVAAPQYVDYVMTFTQKTVNDESVFPTKFDKEFPTSFESIVKKIHRLLFHVIAHVYQAHIKEVVLLNLHAHLNTLFSHFMIFNQKFCLVDEKETEVLQDLAVALKLYPSENEKRETDEQNDTGKEINTDGSKHLVMENSAESGAPDNDLFIKEGNKRSASPCIVSQSVSTPFISSSITALHTRASSGGPSNANSCAMDTTIFTGSSSFTTSCGSSPVKFQ